MCDSSDELCRLLEAKDAPGVKALLRDAGPAVVYENEDDESEISIIAVVMMDACDGGDPSSMQMLLDAGMPADTYCDPETKYTILMRAAYVSLESVESILRAGANPDLQDASGWTALMFAVALDQTSGACDLDESIGIVDALLRAGARQDLQSDAGLTAVDILKLQYWPNAEGIQRVRDRLD